MGSWVPGAADGGNTPRQVGHRKSRLRKDREKKELYKMLRGAIQTSSCLDVIVP